MKAVSALGLALSLFLTANLLAVEHSFVRGDSNGDGAVDISDSILVLFDLFVSPQRVDCRKAADGNDSGSVDVTDVIFSLSFLFRGGPVPPAPFPGCGFDPTADGLSCDLTACPLPRSDIQIEPECTSDQSTLQWLLTNALPNARTLSWAIQGSALQGTVDLPPLGASTLSTPRIPGENVLVVSEAGSEAGRLSQGRIYLSEILASNADSLADQDGDSSDWIEIGAVDSPCVLLTDLSGWYLTDDPSQLTRWKLPNTSLVSGGYLLVFASGKDRAAPGSELHTNFKLKKEGGYLALVQPDGITLADAFEPSYPPQLQNVSYGPVRKTTVLVPAGAQASYHVPVENDAALGESWADPAYITPDWPTGPTGLGFSSIATEGFEVTCIKSRVVVDSIAKARTVLTTPGQQAKVTKETHPFIDFLNSGASANFANDVPFPGLGTADVEDFVVQAKGTVLIPQPGLWSFGVSSDDGFHLDITDGTKTFSMEYGAPRGPSDTIQAFNFSRAGAYDLTLIYYERGGGSELELFAGQGNHPAFNYDNFHLVGDAEHGGLSLPGFASAVGTDVESILRGVNASLWARLEFQVDTVEAFGSLLLRMKYEDGFIAYLNGHKVVSRNSPGTPRWNSAALSNRVIEKVSVAEEISLTGSLGFMVNGRNVLAIHGLNEAAADGDFLILPELIATGKDVELQYMRSATPGKQNLPGGADFVRDVEFSIEHGFFEAPISLELSTPTADAEIRYTLDGSTPTSTHGTVYAGPLAVSRTSVVRAAGFKTDYLDSSVRTQTYIFVSDVIRQSPAGQRPGAGWPSGSVNGQAIDYGMDPDIVNNAKWSGQIKEALLAIPSVSVVTDLDNLFGAANGIYVHATSDGRAWERRASIELVHPDGSPGFTIDGGLRIRGAYSRSGGNPKHAFHVNFRSEYGAGELEYPLFGGEGVDHFDKIDFRCSENYSWAFEGSNQDTIIREVFSRDVQRDMGEPYTRSRYYHLYIDGQYWGVYQSEERAVAGYAASYLGGADSEYDVIKNNSSSSRVLEAADGTMDSYRRLYDAAVAGFATDAALFKVLGLKPDGTTDPAGEKLVNAENLMDYMACTYYTGDPDAPVSCWGLIANNMYGIYDRVRKDGFVWIRHDAEHSLGANGGLNEARLLTDATCRAIGQDWGAFNPAWLHRRLALNPEYALAFADRVNQHFSAGGALSPEQNIARWMRRHDELQLPIIAESARWGDSKSNPPRTRDDWQGQTDYMVSTYFPKRGDIVLAQMRSQGLFPGLAVVSFNLPRGEVPPGSTLTLSQVKGTVGTIYYTLDGSDPRLRGGAVAPGAAAYQDETITIDRTTTVKARVSSAAKWGALSEARFTVGLKGLVINEVMAENTHTLEDPDEPAKFPDWIEIYNGSPGMISLNGMYLTDDPLDLKKWPVPPGLSLASHGYLVFLADNDPEQGPLHTSFRLSVHGDTLALVDQDGKTIIDLILFDEQRTDVAYGRSPDGGSAMGYLEAATPGSANHGIAP